uniref:NADH dehydrogenase subunit 6 n=1 Tax=Wiebesia pumilae TaxID=150944 RepID=A0A8A3UTX4_9HYME|nr:NADH dehydrogenase subunit 6 [Wiebesia pumilae]
MTMKMISSIDLTLLSNYLLIILLLTIKPSKFMNPMHAKIILIVFIFISMFNFNFMSYNHMIPMIMFLILIGGLMIIFLYFTSFIGKFSPINIKNSILTYLNIIMFLFFMFFSYEKYVYFPWLINISRIMPLNNLYLESPKNMNNSLLTMYSINDGMSMLFILFFLLYSLYVIIKLCKSSGKTMRKMT